MLFNAEEHGVFKVTLEKCIGDMRSKSDVMLVGMRNKATPRLSGEKPICCFDTSVASRGLMKTPNSSVCVFVCVFACARRVFRVRFHE